MRVLSWSLDVEPRAQRIVLYIPVRFQSMCGMTVETDIRQGTSLSHGTYNGS